MDKRFVTLRREFDMNAITRNFKAKADLSHVKQVEEAMFGSCSILEEKIQKITSDLTLSIKVLQKMNRDVNDLKEINNDVLIGKRNANCLVCSKSQPGDRQVQVGKGTDGKVYQSVRDPLLLQRQSGSDREDLTETQKLYKYESNHGLLKNGSIDINDSVVTYKKQDNQEDLLKNEQHWKRLNSVHHKQKDKKLRYLFENNRLQQPKSLSQSKIMQRATSGVQRGSNNVSTQNKTILASGI